MSDEAPIQDHVCPGGERAGTVRVDFHAHTHFSRDGVMSPGELVDRARRVDLDRVAVTDHGTIEGAVRARALDPELIIVGEEIRCADWTEVIGLFLRRPVPAGRPLEETVEAIRTQGGVVYLPHPYAYLTRAEQRVERCLELVDCVEVHNARAFWPGWNERAERSAASRGLGRCAGSDAHFPEEVGRAHTEIGSFRTAAELRDRLPNARPGARELSSPVQHLRSLGVRTGRRLMEALPYAGWGPAPDGAITRASAPPN